MNHVTLQEANQVFSKLEKKQEQLQDAIDFQESSIELRDESDHLFKVICSYSGFSEIILNKHELEVILTLTISRLRRELRDLHIEFENIS